MEEKTSPGIVGEVPDMWVAIVDMIIVSAGKDLGKVEIEAEEKTGISRKRIC